MIRAVFLGLIALSIGGLADAVNDVAAAIRAQKGACSVAANPVPLVEENHS